MKFLGKILWGCVSTLICAFYNLDARGAVTCTYSIAEQQDLGAYTGATNAFSFATCSAATICADEFRTDCRGTWGALYQKLSTNISPSHVTVCSAGYYISACDKVTTNPTRSQLYGLCAGGFKCTQCPNDGSNSYPGNVNSSERLTFSIDGQSVMYNGDTFSVCGAIDPFTGATTGKLTMYKIKPSCTGAFDDRYSIDSCFVHGGADGIGSYVFINSCVYAR